MFRMFCDRCGVEMAKGERNSRNFLDLEAERYKVKITIHRKAKEDGECCFEPDLCASCIMALVESAEEAHNTGAAEGVEE